MKHVIITLALLLLFPLFMRAQIEHVDVEGAVTLKQSVLGTPVAGTIDWDGTRFRGYNGANWLWLDDQTQWQVFPGPVGPELMPLPLPATVQIGMPGPPNPGGWLYINDIGGPVLPHMIYLEDAIGFEASMCFGRQFVTQYSVGLDLRNYFHIAEAPVLPPPPVGPNPSSYGNQQTALEIQPGTGIVNMPRQSKARAWLSYPQFIPSRIWTPIIFDQITYDEHNEFTVTPTPAPPSAGGPPETSFFTATEEGWYHVEARCEYNTYETATMWDTITIPPWYEIIDTLIIDTVTGDETLIQDTICYMGPGYIIIDGVDPNYFPETWISIAVFSGVLPGFTNIHSQGNNLQIAKELPVPGLPEPLFIINERNNAPNVSGLVHLKAGEIISIWTWHTAFPGLNLQTWFYPGEELPGPHSLPPPQYPHESKVYVSITKVN